MGIIINHSNNTMQTKATQKSFSMSQLVVKMLEESPWSSMLMLSQRPLKTSEPFALEKKESESKESHFISRDLLSIELSMSLWLKEEISLLEMEQVESLSMAINSQMRTSM